jgi:hypothetical protein
MNRPRVVTRQPSPPLIALALAGVLLLLLLGVVLTALVVSDLGALTGELGVMPTWMSAWLLVLGAFLAVILGWSLWVLAGWLAMWVTRRMPGDLR